MPDVSFQLQKIVSEIKVLRGKIRNDVEKILDIVGPTGIDIADPVSGKRESYSLNLKGDRGNVTAAVEKLTDLIHKWEDLYTRTIDSELVWIRDSSSDNQPTSSPRTVVFWRLSLSNSIPGEPFVINKFFPVIEKIIVTIDREDFSKTELRRVSFHYLSPPVLLPGTAASFGDPGDFDIKFAGDTHNAVWIYHNISATSAPDFLYYWNYPEPLPQTSVPDFPEKLDASFSTLDLGAGLVSPTITSVQATLNAFYSSATIDRGGGSTFKYTGDASSESSVDTTVIPGFPSDVTKHTWAWTPAETEDISIPDPNLRQLEYFIFPDSPKFDGIYSDDPASGGGTQLDWTFTNHVAAQAGRVVLNETITIDANGYSAMGTWSDSGPPAKSGSYTYSYAWGDTSAQWSGDWWNFSGSITSLVNTHGIRSIMSSRLSGDGTHTVSGEYFPPLSYISSPGDTKHVICSLALPKEVDFGNPDVPAGWSGGFQMGAAWDNPPFLGGPAPFANGHSDFYAGDTSGSESYSIPSGDSVSASFSAPHGLVHASSSDAPTQLLPLVSIMQHISQQQQVTGNGPASFFMWHNSLPPLKITPGSAKDPDYLLDGSKDAAQDYMDSVGGGSSPPTGTASLTLNADLNGQVIIDAFGSIRTDYSMSPSPSDIIFLVEKHPGDGVLSVVRGGFSPFSVDDVVDENDSPMNTFFVDSVWKIFINNARGLYGVLTHLGLVLEDSYKTGTLKLKTDVTVLIPDSFSTTPILKHIMDITDS